MDDIESRKQKSDDRLIDDLNQLEIFSLGERAATCLVCGSFLRELELVVVYVFRPAGESVFQIGHVLCDGDRGEYPSEFTLGVRELLVEGRVGWCFDGATQSSWPVLLAPEVLGVSAAATKSIRWCSTVDDRVDQPVSSGECGVER